MAGNTPFAISQKTIDCEVLILLSGGIDSAACVDFYIDIGRKPCGLHINYGQPASGKEAESAKAIADYYSIPLFYSRWEGYVAKTVGFINGRNSFLIAAALMERPQSVSVIGIGIHGGTVYQDCSGDFLAKMQNVIDQYENGKVQLSAPFLDFSKSEIYSYCIKRRIPIELTYSCETGSTPPCGKCLSCKDRELLNACL
jgi:7-cyano-7-deazaguanine synthase